MSVTTTTKLGLVKPTPGTSEPVDRGTMNTDYDKLDDAVGAKVCTSSTRPTGSDAWVGRIIRESDTGFMYVCTVAGTPGPAVWRQILVDSGAGFFADDQLILVERTGAQAAQRYRRVGDSQQRLEVSSDGVMLWGSGSATGDTNLFRDSANVLRTNDSLTVDGNLSVAGTGRIIIVRKTADTSRNTSTTLTDDPHLQANGLVTGSQWYVDLSIALNAGATPDIKWDFTLPAGASFSRYRIVTQGTAALWTEIVANNSTVKTLSTNGADQALLISGVLRIGGTAGDFRWRWAQNTSDAGNTTVYTDSAMKLIRF
jgi:hypothetical protein